MLFNEKLGKVVNLSLHNFGYSIQKMSDNRFLSGSNILDANGKTIANLSGFQNIQYCAKENVISLSKDGVYGLIDTDGIVLVALEYESPFNFYNGIARNKNYYNDTTYLINKNGLKTLDASGSSSSVYSNISGIFYEYKDNNCIIKNYTGAQLAKIENCSNIYAYSTFNGEASSYLSGQLILVYANGSSTYYILK